MKTDIMTDYSIIIIGLLAGVLFFYKSRNKQSSLITLLLIVSYLLCFIPKTITLSLILLGFSLLTGLIYPFFGKNSDTIKRVVLLIFIVPIFLIYLFSMLQWPYFGQLRYSQLISVGVFIYMLFNYKKYKPEMSFTVLFLTYALTKLF
jgi:hypothetical protein